MVHMVMWVKIPQSEITMQMHVVSNKAIGTVRSVKTRLDRTLVKSIQE